MGALTAKPIAYSGRPWEYDEDFALDLFDSFGANLIINTRGTSIIRILPRINKYLNKFIISDKARFSFDALTQQRVLQPMVSYYDVSTKSNKLIVCALYDLLPIITIIISLITKLHVIFGNFLNTAIVDKLYYSLTSILNTQQLYITADTSTQNKSALWSNLLYPAEITQQSNYDTILILNSNLRFELPNLFYQLQQNVAARRVNSIYLFGSSMALTSNDISIGHREEDLLQIINGKKKITKYLSQTQTLLIAVGASFVNFNILLHLIKRLQSFGIFINIINTWLNPVNVQLQLYNYLTTPLLSQFFLQNNIQEHAQALLLVNTGITPGYLSNYKYKIYIGSHALSTINKFNIVLPIRHFYETTGHFFNFQGTLQTSFRIIDNSELLYHFYDIIRMQQQQLNILIKSKI